MLGMLGCWDVDVLLDSGWLHHKFDTVWANICTEHGREFLMEHWSALLQQFDRGILLWFIACEGVIALALSWPL